MATPVQVRSLSGTQPTYDAHHIVPTCDDSIAQPLEGHLIAGTNLHLLTCIMFLALFVTETLHYHIVHAVIERYSKSSKGNPFPSHQASHRIGRSRPTDLT